MHIKLGLFIFSILLFGQLSLCQLPTDSDYLEQKGYRLSYRNGRYYVYTDSYDDGDDPVDIIGIDKYDYVITVYEAYNGWEERDESGRLKLRDIQMELWDIQPDVRRSDLTAVRRKGIVNKKTARQIRRVYETLEENEDETIILNSSDSGSKGEAWELLEDTPFFGGTAKLLDEYNVGKRIYQIVIRPTDQSSGDHDLEFRFD
uniref:EC32 protein n=1 Tax=Colletotrichum higginsianum TaxID=80884 RepID=I2G7A8_9PEZI|nr:EC32 protein [Colletotrichum higginsianum]